MSPELEEELVARYPLLFEIDRDWGSREISEHWAIRCGDGWYGLIDATCRVLHELTTRMFEQTRGALVWMPRVSFYVDPGERPDQGGLLRVDLFDRDHCPQPPYPEPGTVMTPATYVYQLSDGISWMATDASSVICEVCGNAGRTPTCAFVATLTETFQQRTLRLFLSVPSIACCCSVGRWTARSIL
jgi:hypothetical protein